MQEYKNKLRTAEEAVKLVKNGDWVDYGTFQGFPFVLDRALAARRDELSGVRVHGNLIPNTIQVVESDPDREHFFYMTWHCSAYERKLVERGLCSFAPMTYCNHSAYYRDYLDVDVAMITVAPMDERGYFNLGCMAGAEGAMLAKAKKIIVEVNENMPRVYGDPSVLLHIDRVDCIVEGENQPMAEMPPAPPAPEDTAIAEHILPYICDGAVLQLGIGKLPDILGTKIAESDVKDLAMHTELCSTAYLDLFKAGKLTNNRKSYHNGKGVFALAAGTKEVYDWINENDALECLPIDVVNDPAVIAQNDNMISINSCVSVNLFGEISSETSGLRHISGTGGQLDFVTGAPRAKGGKSFITTASTFKDKAGKIHSKIVPYFTGGDIITVPRSMTHYVVTEYGAVNLWGQSTWDRAERLISIAHPDFREELKNEAEKMGIWKRSNKR